MWRVPSLAADIVPPIFARVGEPEVNLSADGRCAQDRLGTDFCVSASVGKRV